MEINVPKITVIWCPNCGKIKVINYKYPQCPICGAAVEEDDIDEQNNSKRKRDNENSFRKRPRF